KTLTWAYIRPIQPWPAAKSQILIDASGIEISRQELTKVAEPSLHLCCYLLFIFVRAIPSIYASVIPRALLDF
ncbi:MAG: hypothetical protein AAF456_20590, partial [Planctomycetota bacterium]